MWVSFQSAKYGPAAASAATSEIRILPMPDRGSVPRLVIMSPPVSWMGWARTRPYQRSQIQDFPRRPPQLTLRVILPPS